MEIVLSDDDDNVTGNIVNQEQYVALYCCTFTLVIANQLL